MPTMQVAPGAAPAIGAVAPVPTVPQPMPADTRAALEKKALKPADRKGAAAPAPGFSIN
jgi:pilus assembly protein CpaC